MKNEFRGSDIKATDCKQVEINGHGVGAKEKVDKGDTKSASTNLDQPLLER